MTDKEIEKLLEQNANETFVEFYSPKTECRYEQLTGADILDYIKRLKAENERLTKMECVDDCTICPYSSIVQHNAEDWAKIEVENARKATAKEIVQKLIDCLECIDNDGCIGMFVFSENLFAIAKEYGVEVEE